MKHSSPFPLVLILSLVALMGAAASPGLSQEVLWEQPPLAFGGGTSDGVTITIADDFRLSSAANLGQVLWYGGYGSAHLPRPDGDSFTMRIFSDDGGRPGLVLATYTFGTEARRAPITPTDFEYSFSLPTPLALEGNRTYWLSITNVPTSLFWTWMGSSFGQENCTPNATCSRRSFNSPITGPWEENIDNMAFGLLGGTIGCPEVAIELQIEPAVINPRAGGRWVTAYLEPPLPYAADQINQSTMLFLTERGYLTPDPEGPVELGDNDNDGVPDLAVKFKRTDVISALAGNPTTVFVTGEFLSPAGTCFRGSDEVRVVGETGPGPSEELVPGAGDPPGVALALHGTKPHPSRAGASLAVSFGLPDARPARLELLDIAGRRVAVREVGGLGPGRHTAQLSTGRLAAGVYLLRLTRGVESRENRVVVVP